MFRRSPTAGRPEPSSDCAGLYSQYDQRWLAGLPEEPGNFRCGAYRAELDRTKVLKLSSGFSTPVQYAFLTGFSIKMRKASSVAVSGITRNKSAWLQRTSAAEENPKPYKGKGIRYAGEKSGGKSENQPAHNLRCQFSVRKCWKRKENRRDPDLEGKEGPRQRFSGRTERAQLSVFRKRRTIYVQSHRRRRDRRLLAASTLNSELRDTPKARTRRSSEGSGEADSSPAVGKKELPGVVFDRGRFLYHGRVKALADSLANRDCQF